MASLKQIATEVIDALDQPFNELLYQRVKDLIVHERSLAIRRSIGKNGIDDEFKQRYKVPMIRIDKSDFYGITTDLEVFRSTNKIAKLVRYRGDSPFIYVGAVTHDIPYLYTQSFAVPAQDSLRYMKYIGKYTYDNGYLYVMLHDNTLENIGVQAIQADPREIDYSDYATAPFVYTDDMEFLISEDLISDIKLRMFSGDLKLRLTDDQEVNIEDDEVNR